VVQVDLKLLLLVVCTKPLVRSLMFYLSTYKLLPPKSVSIFGVPKHENDNHISLATVAVQR